MEAKQVMDDIVERVILRCVVGSRAYGLDREGSDTDRRGVYLPPAELHWSLAGAPPQLQNEATQEVYWEIQKFIMLALKANPNILGVSLHAARGNCHAAGRGIARHEGVLSLQAGASDLHALRGGSVQTHGRPRCAAGVR